MALKAIILDFDGVIVESNAIKHQAFAEIFKDFPGFYRKMMNFHMSHNHMPRDEKFRYLYKHFLGKADCESEVHSLVRRFRGLTRARVIKSPFVCGAMDFIRRYSKKMPLYIASATPQSELKVIVKAKGLSRYFKGVYGAPSEKKDVIRKVIKREGCRPCQVLFVGDSPEDHNTASVTKVDFIARVSGGCFDGVSVRKYDDFYGIRSFLEGKKI